MDLRGLAVSTLVLNPSAEGLRAGWIPAQLWLLYAEAAPEFARRGHGAPTTVPIKFVHFMHIYNPYVR